MERCKDILLVVDYHAENLEIRRFNYCTGEDSRQRLETSRANILRLVEQGVGQAQAQGGRLRWIMESTTGWARVKELLGQRVDFVLVNVLRMPREPKAYRRKSDQIDTARILREELNGNLPRAYQTPPWWRQARRLVNSRQDLVGRQTAIKNWISSFLRHETWEDQSGLWSKEGLARLKAMKLPDSDRFVLDTKLEQLAQVQDWIARVEGQMQALYERWPAAKRADEVRGIGMVTAVSVLAHIGPVKRFPTANDLISFAGLSPGHRGSDTTSRDGHIGGGGTDSHLRYLVVEATTWLAQIPRYKPAFERVCAKRGKNIARIVVARMFLRSLYKMLTDNRRFNQAA